MTPSNGRGPQSAPAALASALVFGASGTFLAVAGRVWFSAVTWVIALVAFALASPKGLRSATRVVSSISRFLPRRPTNRRHLARALARAKPRHSGPISIAHWARIVGRTARTRPYRSVLGVSGTLGLVVALLPREFAVLLGIGATAVGLRDARVPWTAPLRAAVVLLLLTALTSGVPGLGRLSDTGAAASFLAATLAMVSGVIGRLQRPRGCSVVR